MKRLLLVALAVVGYCHIANAQIIYQPFIPNRSQPSQSQYQYQPQGISDQSPQQYQRRQQSSSQQTIRATAYYEDSGSYYKAPIQVTVKSSGGSVSYHVTAYYVDNGIGGSWQNISYGGQAQKCNSALSNDPLEEQFMYKALVNAKWFYFDL